MDDVKNTVRVLHFLPRWDNGGMEHAVLDIVKHFKNNNFTYEICTAFLESEYGFDEMKERNIVFFEFYKNKIYSFKKCIIGFSAFLKREKYDIIHCHVNNSIGLIFAAIAKRAGTRCVVIHTHNNAFGTGKILVKRILRKISILLFSNKPDIYLACSDEAGKWSFGKNVEKKRIYHVVYNGIVPQRFLYNNDARNELRKKYSLLGKYVIGHIGHFNYQKNQAFILKSIRNIVCQIPDAHFFFVGTGEKRGEFIKEVEELKVKDYVTVIDSVNNPQDFYSMFDLFVFPSRFEGFGIVMIEAQMSGLPIICSEHVPRETDISRRVRYLSIDEDDSVNEWAESITRCYYDEMNVSRTRIQDCGKYDISTVSSKIESFYSEFMERDK